MNLTPIDEATKPAAEALSSITHRFRTSGAQRISLRRGREE